MPAATAEVVLHCSFCGKSQHDVEKLIAGPGIYICNECVHLCDDILAEEPRDFARWEELSEEDLLHRMVNTAESRDRVDETVGIAVRLLREKGVTWARIGEALGITRQSAWERYSGEE